MRLVFLTLFVLLGCVSLTLIVYSYDSFVPLADETFEAFSRETGITVELRTLGDSGALLSAVIATGEKFDGDVVIGIDDLLARRAFQANIFLPYEPAGSQEIIDDALVFDPLFRLTPYDFGAIALIYDRQTLSEPVEKLEDLTNDAFKRSLLLQDPRTSSTGLAFLVWTYLLYGENFEEFWRSLMPSILTITLGWDDAFGKFEAGEAPIMVSYATDGAYSTHYYGQSLYGVLIPEGKGYVQIEGAGILRWSSAIEDAKKFMDFLLTPQFQKHIPLTQWMFPVTGVELPPVFEHAARPSVILKAPAELDLEELLARWEEIIYEK